MRGAEDFGPGFQRVLARACLTDPGLRALVARFAQAGQLGFTDPAAAWAWAIISGEDHPSPLMLETEARRLSETDPARVGVGAVLAADTRDEDYVRRRVVEWTRQQVFRAAFDEAAAEWNAGRTDQAYSRMMARMEEMAQIMFCPRA